LRWRGFNHNGKEYDLSHLHPKTVSYFQAAKGQNPLRVYQVDLIYSLHCFTRGSQGEIPDAALLYSDDRETRVFDFPRYEFSLQLPAITEGLMTCKCFHADRGNFFTLKVLDNEGNKVDYEIYFTVSRSSKQGVLNLFVQSAYSRDVSHRQNKPRIAPKPIGFSVILYNTLNRKPIKSPK
jgi:hypothetical protein